MKKIILAIFLLFAISTYSQTNTTYGYYDGCYSIGFTITLDSNATSTTTQYYDLTRLNLAGTVYCTYSYVQAYFDHTNGNDTSVIYLKGKDVLGNTLNCDTISTGVVSYIAQTTADNVKQTTLTLSSVFPQVAVYVAPLRTGPTTTTSKNGKLGVIKITFWGYFPTIPFKDKIYWN